MTFTRPTRLPGVPTLPHGEQIASYATYLDAQRAVDHLSDKEFPVQHVTIVGTDLQMVERVTGRLTYSRVAVAGLASGAWFGLFVGLLLSLFSPSGSALPVLPAVGIGAAFGILFSVISYAFAGGRRDFTSASQIVASAYGVLCAAEHAGKARALLQADGGPGLGRSVRVAPGSFERPAEPLGAPPSQAGYAAPVPPAAPAQPAPRPEVPPAQPGTPSPPTQPPVPPTQPPVPPTQPPVPPTQPPAGPGS